VRAKRSLGQNFLVDPNIQRKIVAALEPGPADEVLEIGPGTGALTRHLAAQAGRVVAIEKDDDLAAALRDEFEGAPHVEVVHGDVLEVDLGALVREPDRVKVVGNIPYNITSPLLFRLLESELNPERIVVMVQREVADRLLAEPGEKNYGALSVGMRAVARVRRLFHVGRAAFRPVPDVDSTVVLIVPYRPARLTPAERVDLRTLTRAAFGWRRKQLQKILRTADAYRLDAEELEAVARESGIEPERRPETLSPEEFVSLMRVLRRRGYPREGSPPGAPGGEPAMEGA
jgi:16S rRNA (adenine1518-N6/adenine1519-N6)-dimethyltransferase